MAIQTNDDVARKLRGLAAEKRASTSHLAKALSLSRMAMWRRMQGEVPLTGGEIITLAGVLGVHPVAFFIEGVDDSSPSPEVAAVAS